MVNAVQSGGGAAPQGGSDSDALTSQATSLVQANTRFGAVDTWGLAKAVSGAGGGASLTQAVDAQLEPRDQAAFHAALASPTGAAASGTAAAWPAAAHPAARAATTSTSTTAASPAAGSTSGVQHVSATVGRNTATWTIDNGRTVEADADIKEAFDGAERGSKENALTAKVGNSGGRTDDDGGHMIAHRFMKDEGERNMFPQNSNLNRGAYKTIENEWADWTKAGGEVKTDVKLEDFDGDNRPEEVDVTYSVENKDGKTVYKNQETFQNEKGQHFTREPKADMAGVLAGTVAAQ